ncbi:hypothetical protein Y1Q_0003207 [Alligator mississippiensis]|uniref:Uncharacterized protein n=1 Tax=Alligator mississippiensis TaxID=8496 RepID=A0A151MDY3_ALLMI|nr:hypothetical protein Y1Q_0003207 [Alligator mississippiensis]
MNSGGLFKRRLEGALSIFNLSGSNQRMDNFILKYLNNHRRKEWASCSAKCICMASLRLVFHCLRLRRFSIIRSYATRPPASKGPS